MSAGRQRTLGSGVQHVLDYLKRMQAENPAFFYAIQNDTDHSLGNIFWADSTSKMNYSYFGDTVVFDTVYRTNRYRVPFAAFTGFNHHGQPVLFGCALVLNESDSSFIWLLQTWLHAMSGQHPVSITTDPDRLIQVAVAQVLPDTRHRYSKHGILRETQEKMAHIYQTHPTFEIEFKKCINETETIDEFELSWQTLLQRYYVMDNEWLQSMHNARQQWVPVYMRNTFFGELSVTEASGDLNSFFDGFVTASTTIQMLIKQYEKAVASWHEKELKADYDTTNTMPVLKTPSPMEKQAANLYTRKIFMKFQEELVETLANPATKIDDSGTISTYRVAKFGEEIKAHTVSFNSFEMKASCSCQMFEYKGIICRHVLAVFRGKNVLTLPTQYILKRWTRNVKSGAVLDERASELPTNSRESLTVRYNNLRQEAIKYVEEGAKSIHIYNVAMDALQDAAKKVAAVKNKSPGATQDGALSNGSGQELHVADENRVAASQSADEKEKKIRELTAELESTNQRCEVYRANLLAVLRDMEEQKLKLSVKVQNARLSLKE
ncbi:protein FAR1-RELATED SEQUENCE 9 [Ricinus communis]|uniref:protein FAR1-RELATED SEQUENCE 9 n=1 Tax=Ricinus communis TaxID=3988 RepID=UPI0007723FC9|nr:protein FAR1-RELATED SEQUENCE 9 [Ricinus communis]|eukprot:XP_015571858.1 protein FAR1-RELATED SEQUENCE 9 [Ricinus communis]